MEVEVVEGASPMVHCENLASNSLWIKIDGFELPFTPQYLSQKYGWDLVYARTAIKEYKKFLFLALTSEVAVTPSLDIDEVWHVHILHTRGYRSFCNLIGRNLDHDPGMPNARGDFQGQYRATLRYYSKVFQCPAPGSIWPVPG